MTLNRREVLGGLAALGGCGGPTVTHGGVFAAGQPAAVLVFILAPDRLLGWPRRPAPGALALLPPVADRPERGALTGGGAPANPEAVAALRPALIIDYGDLEPSYRAVAKRFETRIGSPYRLIDGALDRIPSALREAGALLGVEARGRRLAEVAEGMLGTAGQRASASPGFYYARGRDGLETGFTGSLATEVLERAGWTNVARGARDLGRVSLEQVVAWDPEVVVTLDAGFARAAIADPVWRLRRAGAPRRLLLFPDYPFGWIDRPPSVNRLLGCAWLRDERAGGAMAARFAELFYGTASDLNARMPLPRWIA